MTRRQMLTTLAAMSQAHRLKGATVDYHYFITVGQSLAIGTNGTPPISTTQPYGNKTVDGSGFHDLTANLNVLGLNVEDSSPSMANQFSSLISPATYNSVFYRAGLGSSPYTALKKGTTPYTNSITNAGNLPTQAASLGKTYEFAGICCIHGESDTDSSVGTTGAQYVADLLQWRSDYKTDLTAIGTTSSAFPFFTDQCDNWNNGVVGVPGPVDGSGNFGVPLAQWQAMRDNPGLIYTVSPLYFLPYSSSVHLTNNGYLWLGERFGKWMKRVISDGAKFTGLVPRSITRSGATITARFWLMPGRSLVIDTSTVSDKGAGKGFEFFDNSGSPPAISSVSVSGDTATITLASTPAGGNQRLRYAYTGTVPSVGGTPGQAHGNIRNDDPTVGVTSGTSLYDWLITFDEPVGFSWTPFGASTASSGAQINPGITIRQ